MVIELGEKFRPLALYLSDARAKKAIFLGYAKGVKGYRLWCVEDSKFVISRDVTFDERSMVALSKANMPSDGDVRTSKTQVVEIEELKSQPSSSRVQVVNHGGTQDEEDDELDHEEVQEENAQVLQQQQHETLASTRSRRN